MLKKVFVFLVIFIGFCSVCCSQPYDIFKGDRSQKVWVDSLFGTMSLDEKIGQLFMVAAYAKEGKQQISDIEFLIDKYHIGGLIFMQGSPELQVKLTNRFQERSEIPLMIGMDMEWGAGMRLGGVMDFPKQISLGAVEGEEGLYAMGSAIAQQMKALGVHINFAPVVDINTNPDNPVIGYRSFGESVSRVSLKGLAYMRGLQDHGVMACAKHFPGHGDTRVDSHIGLAKIGHDRERLDSVELQPFRKMIEGGVGAVMTAHLHVPAYESLPIPATLSSRIVTGLLKDTLGFEGLVFTDALNMKSVTQGREPGEIESAALSAGGDVLLFSGSVPAAIKELKKNLRKRKVSKYALDRSVKKILAAKYWLGLKKKQRLREENLSLRLSPPENQFLARRLFEGAVTMVRNQNAFLPIRVLDTLSFASLSIGDEGTAFTTALDGMAPFVHFKASDKQVPLPLLDSLDDFGVVVVGLFGLKDKRGRDNYGLSPKQVSFLRALGERTRVVLSVFGSPYLLPSFDTLPHVLCAYEDHPMLRRLLPEMIFGAVPIQGTLPVAVSPDLPVGTGVKTQSLGRLGYGIPEEVGMDGPELDKIDAVVREAVQDRAIPGCQVLVAKDGRVVFEKSYGFYTYDSLRPVTPNTIYDVASITKVAATLQCLMFMEERGMIDVDKKVSHYLPEIKGSNKEDMIFRDILTHQAGLWPYLPFWKGTLSEKGDYLPTFYGHRMSGKYSMPVTSRLYAVPSLEDSVWQWVLDARLRKKQYRKPYTYKYSDMGYYMMHRLSERMFNQPMEDFLDQNLYQPLGLSTMGYLPLDRFPLERIAPTEQDDYFRKTLVHGRVHDQGAAMYDGVAGHAGLFSNAHDLAKLMQMHLQDGVYGGTRYYQKGTVERFSRQQYKTNRRGMAWDKPLMGRWFGPTSRYASQDAFGHTGFTGTAVWVDPKFNLIYVFLSNRIYPSASNKKLIRYNVRTRIQDIIYQSIWLRGGDCN